MFYALRNRVQLIGHVGAPPDVRSNESGRKWARFRMATNELYQNAQGEWVKETQWHSLIAWGKQAEKVEKHLPIGKEIAVEGKLVSRSYTNKEGVKKYITEVHVNELFLLDKAN